MIQTTFPRKNRTYKSVGGKLCRSRIFYRKKYSWQKGPRQLTGRFNSFKQREVQHAIHNENTDSELQGWCSDIIYPITVLNLKNFSAKMIELNSLISDIKIKVLSL